MLIISDLERVSSAEILRIYRKSCNLEPLFDYSCAVSLKIWYNLNLTGDKRMILNVFVILKLTMSREIKPRPVQGK